MAEAWELDNGPARVAILEEAVRLADALGDLEYSIETRNELIEAATFSGADEKSLVAFSWCLARFDEDPEPFDEDDLLWRYKWIVGTVAGFPRVPKSRIHEMEDDLELRLAKAGYGPAPAHQLRAENGLTMGDLERAGNYYQQWKSTPKDNMADCSACLLNQEVRYFIRMERDKEALKAAKPLLDGRLICEVVPESTFGSVLLSMMRLGLHDDAAATHLKGYRKVAGDSNYLEEVAEHLMYLVCQDNTKKGSRLLEKHLGWALDSASGLPRFEFFLSATLLVESLGRRRGRSPLKLLLPRAFPLWNEEGRYKAGELAAWFRDQTTQLARQFDDRNGNQCRADQIRNMTGIVETGKYRKPD